MLTLLLGCISVGAESSGAIAAPSEWAIKSVSQADRIGILRDIKKSWWSAITREQFCKLAYNMLSIAIDTDFPTAVLNSFDDTDNEKVLALASENIIKGKGNRRFAPDDILTREEAAVILNRIAEKYGDFVATEIYFTFPDEADISSWATNDIQRICNLGIMKGTDVGFEPKSEYTTEQSIATIMRLYTMLTDADETAFLPFADKLNIQMPTDKNYMFSPLSIKMALLMAANGSSGKTQAQILSTLGIEDIESANNNVRLMLDEYQSNDTLRLDIANSAWINSDKTNQNFATDYKKTLKSIFNADCDTVTNKTGANKINGWVNEKTNGKIPTIISDSYNDFMAMLVNTVYFKAEWQNQFSKSATQKDSFTDKNGKVIDIDFMNKTGYMSYAEKDGIKIVSLPYRTIADENGISKNISMYLMMSDNDFNPTTSLLDADFTSRYVRLAVPKFEITNSISLNDILKSIGIKKAFTRTAEFDGMFETEAVQITDVLHKTYIKVNEEGTEAAAATGIAVGATSMPPEPLVLKFNKPFTFVIKDNINGEVLFIGQHSFAE